MFSKYLPPRSPVLRGYWIMYFTKVEYIRKTKR
jgi:hypothetical protein